jgi:hypothetical protein
VAHSLSFGFGGTYQLRSGSRDQRATSIASK